MPNPIINMSKISTALTKLKCDICNNHLSFFPILLSTKGENICGRCTPNSKEVPTTRVLIYESLAKFLTFPCRYKAEGCLIEEVPDELEVHEYFCPFRVVPCPIPSCTWEGSHPLVNQHCQNTHKEVLLKGNTDFSVPEDDKYQYNLLLINQQIIVVKSMYDLVNKSFKFSVHYPSYHDYENEEITTITSCQIVLKFEKTTCSTEVKATSFEDSEFTSINISGLITDHNDLPRVRSAVNLGSTVEKVSESSQDKINSDLLSVLKCSKCLKYVLPPIYESGSKDIICTQCQPRSNSYGFNGTSSSSNICLNKLANLVKYPCQFQDSGCTFSDKPSRMRGHQQKCEYRSIECCACSTWNGHSKDLAAHLRSDHKIEKIPEVFNGTEFTQCDFSFDFDKRIIDYKNHLFVMVYSLGDICNFTVEAIDSQDGGKFQYEIEIQEWGSTYRKIVISDACDELLDSANRFKNHDQRFHYLHKDQFVNSTYIFRISVKIFPV